MVAHYVSTVIAGITVYYRSTQNVDAKKVSFCEDYMLVVLKMQLFLTQLLHEQIVNHKNGLRAKVPV